MEISELKSKYGLLEKKHSLPEFDKLNMDFEIDKIEKDSEFLIRSVRKAMMDKIVNSMSFVEMLLNPVNASRIYFSYIKSMSQEDKKNLDEIYESLAGLSFDSLSLEVESDEQAEASLIKKTYESWNKLKPGFKKIVENIKKPEINNSKKEKSYFG